MRLQLILPRVEPGKIEIPAVCPYEGCEGRHFRHHQEVDKPLMDTRYDSVTVHRYECLRCHRTFRLYPEGVTHAQTSRRVKGLALTVDELPAEDAETLKEWLQPIVNAVGAKLLVTDDADALKTAADELGMDHQVCKGHVKRNTDVQVDSLGEQAKVDQDGSLADIDVPPEQALEDLKRLEALTNSRQPEYEDELGEMHQRYVEAAPPKAGEKASVAYRLRLLFLDRWNLWRRLTRYRTWEGPQGESVDGTNNGCERAIGWWIKERYRTMRGYKRPKSAVNVSRLLAWCGNYLERGGADLAPLLAQSLKESGKPDSKTPTHPRYRTSNSHRLSMPWGR
jgi:hypothetical protein